MQSTRNLSLKKSKQYLRVLPSGLIPMILAFMNMSEYKLSVEIIALSKSKKWDTAKLEWEIAHVEKMKDAETCLCGHYPINEICDIRNQFNNNMARVGNCCVKKFMGISSDKIFATVKKLSSDMTKAANAETIQYAFDNKVVTEWDKNFYLDTIRKKNLTEKQMEFRYRINVKIMKKYSK